MFPTNCFKGEISKSFKIRSTGGNRQVRAVIGKFSFHLPLGGLRKRKTYPTKQDCTSNILSFHFKRISNNFLATSSNYLTLQLRHKLGTHFTNKEQCEAHGAEVFFIFSDN